MVKAKQHGGRREGAGRKPLGKHALGEIVQVRVMPADARRWRSAAKSAKVTLSNLIRAAVEAYIK